MRFFLNQNDVSAYKISKYIKYINSIPRPSTRVSNFSLQVWFWCLRGTNFQTLGGFRCIYSIHIEPQKQIVNTSISPHSPSIIDSFLVPFFSVVARWYNKKPNWQEKYTTEKIPLKKSLPSGGKKKGYISYLYYPPIFRVLWLYWLVVSTHLKNIS